MTLAVDDGVALLERLLGSVGTPARMCISDKSSCNVREILLAIPLAELEILGWTLTQPAVVQGEYSL
jgi:hypothetical protein